MRRYMTTLLMLLALFHATGMFAATNMLTAAGATTAPTSSTCPAAENCSSGWFSVRGAKTAVVQVWETTGSKTSTVILYHRMDSAGAVSILKTWTDVTTTQVPVAVDPPVGEIKITVTAIQSGATVKAKLEASTVTGGRLW